MLRNLATLRTGSLFLILGACFQLGCGPESDGARARGNGKGDDNGTGNGPGGAHIFKGIQVGPADPVLFIDNMTPVTQAFTATALYEDGANEDVTAQAQFTLEKADLGSFSGSTFSSNTAGGFSKVTAQVGTNFGHTIVTLVPRRLDTNGVPLDFFFIAPYNAASDPTSAILTFSTTIKQADVGFIVDTTGSMGSKIDALHSSLSSLAATLKTLIPSVGMGVAEFKDWPCSPYTVPGLDIPFKLDNRIVTVMAGGLAAVQSAIGALTAAGGGDGSESAFDALYAAATGNALNNCNGSGSTLVPAFNAATAPGSVAGETTGTVGGMGFRTGSLPVFVMATDAEMHDADDPADTTFAPVKPYAFGHTKALDAMNAIGGRFVGIASTSGGYDFSPNFAGVASSGWEPYAQMVWLAQQTNSMVPVAAFAGACGPNKCCTGLNGTGVDPIAGLCPMVYKVDSSGGGLGTSVADAISKLVSYGGYDDGTKIVGNTTDESTPGVPLPGSHTTADFLSPVDPDRGVTPLDSMPAVGTPGGPTAIDTAANVFKNVQPGTQLRFTVRVHNDFVEPTTAPQFFKAKIQVVGNGAALLDERDVYILVPPGNDQIL